MAQEIKTIMGLSGGKDSTALAIFMKDTYPELEIDHFFNDTLSELPETYEYIEKLEKILGKKIIRLNYEGGFDALLKKQNGFLPSFKSRYCTRILKIIPTERYIDELIEQGYHVRLLTGIRADEPSRTGYKGKKKHAGRIKSVFPFREHAIGKPEMLKILDDNGIGLAKYYEWRSRSGCYFCFYQRSMEWVELRERHPELFKKAKTYEKKDANGNYLYTWRQGQSLDVFDDPSYRQAVRDRHARRMELKEAKAKQSSFFDNDDFLKHMDGELQDDCDKAGLITCF